MPQIKIDLDAETFDRLIAEAVSERRQIASQAAVTLRLALGLAFPSNARLPVRPPNATGTP